MYSDRARASLSLSLSLFAIEGTGAAAGMERTSARDHGAAASGVRSRPLGVTDHDGAAAEDDDDALESVVRSAADELFRVEVLVSTKRKADAHVEDGLVAAASGREVDDTCAGREVLLEGRRRSAVAVRF